MSSIRGEVRDLAKRLSSLADDMDDSGWIRYSDYIGPEEPETSADNIPKYKDYSYLDWDQFDGLRAEWIDSHLPRYLVWSSFSKGEGFAYWGGNDYGWLNDRAQEVTNIVAWMPLPGEPAFERKTA